MSSCTLTDLPEEVLATIFTNFMEKPHCICCPFPSLSCISCSDYTSLISLLHTSKKLREMIRNNNYLWSRCLFSLPCFLNVNLRPCQKIISLSLMRCCQILQTTREYWHGHSMEIGLKQSPSRRKMVWKENNN